MMEFPCYNCKTVNKIGSLFCSSCKIIQPITHKNYFDIIDIPTDFLIDAGLLERNYLKLQELR